MPAFFENILSSRRPFKVFLFLCVRRISPVSVHCIFIILSCDISVFIFNYVGREGFEPSKAQGQQIYSLSRLTASVPTHMVSRCADLNRGPTPYHGVALPAELQRRVTKREIIRARQSGYGIVRASDSQDWLSRAWRELQGP